MKKILLFICYPIAFIINKDLRKYQKNKIKYWAMDNEYFKKEFKSVFNILLISLTIYFFLFYGIAFIYKSTIYFVEVSNQVSSKIFDDIHNKNLIDVTNKRNFVNANVVVEKSKIEISEDEYKDIYKDNVNVKSDIVEIENDIKSFLKEQKEIKQ